MIRLPPWVERYVGLPYAEVDCWELIRKVYREQWQIILPVAPGGHEQRQGAALWTQEAHRWIEITLEHAQLADVLAFHDRHRGWHAGLVLAHGIMLHTEASLDALWESYDQPRWRNRLAGIFRHPDFSSRAPEAISPHRYAAPVS